MLNLILKKMALGRFVKEKDGNVAILTGFAAMMLMMVVAVAIDMAEIYRAKINFQNALDAATVMAAKVVADTNDQNQAMAAGRKVFEANLRNLNPEKGSVSFEFAAAGCTGAPVIGTGTLDHYVFFDAFHEVSDTSGLKDHVKLKGTTEVDCGFQSLEIALVLDNSASMQQKPVGSTKSSINILKDASIALVDKVSTMFQAGNREAQLKIGLVPFSFSVNVGSNKRGVAWIDNDGKSSIHNENIAWEQMPGAVQVGGTLQLANNLDVYKVGGQFEDKNGVPLTRFTLFDALQYKGQPVEWGGCVEARPYPHNTTDAEPNLSDPDTLFVPSFGPDEPDNLNGELDSRGGTITEEENFYNSYLRDDRNFPERYSDANAPHNTGSYQYRRMIWPWKYMKDAAGNAVEIEDTSNVGSGKLPNVIAYPGGPNLFCTSQEITPLTSNFEDMKIQIGGMPAWGGTNIQQGLVWGWSALSPEEPYSEGKEYDAFGNTKVMILLTDGENTYYPTNVRPNFSDYNGSHYGASGYTRTKRLYQGTSDENPEQTIANNTAAMNELTAETCTNVRNAGIVLYTITFNLPEFLPNGARHPASALMLGCASRDKEGNPQYYNASDSATLTESFNDIVDSLAELRISK